MDGVRCCKKCGTYQTVQGDTCVVCGGQLYVCSLHGYACDLVAIAVTGIMFWYVLTELGGCSLCK
jgi:hypothetical protein